jgi:hypothetical protein
MTRAQLQEGKWISPLHRGFRIECCGCGLVHRMDFRISGHDVQFRVQRVSRRGRKKR